MIGRIAIGLALATCVGLSQVTLATAATKPLKVKVASIKEGAMIPAKFAFCQPAAQGHAGPRPTSARA
jgi:hypothetical protein